MLDEAHLRGPAVVVGVAGLHYPPVHVDPNQETDRVFLDAIDRARSTIEARHKTEICHRGYFMGISDMSFFGHAPDVGNTEIIAANTPIAELVDHPVADALRYPVSISDHGDVNIISVMNGFTRLMLTVCCPIFWRRLRRNFLAVRMPPTGDCGTQSITMRCP